MTRASDVSTYDDDFFAWTQEQAAALRRLPREAIGDAVDIAHVAEEIEDLGERDLREVTSFLARLFEHLMKIDNAPASLDAPHWRSEARTFQRGACDAFSPGMRRALVVDAIWRKAHKRLAQDMADKKTILFAPAASPCKLDELLDEDFDLDAVLAKLAAARPKPGA